MCVWGGGRAERQAGSALRLAASAKPLDSRPPNPKPPHSPACQQAAANEVQSSAAGPTTRAPLAAVAWRSGITSGGSAGPKAAMRDSAVRLRPAAGAAAQRSAQRLRGGGGKLAGRRLPGHGWAGCLRTLCVPVAGSGTSFCQVACKQARLTRAAWGEERRCRGQRRAQRRQEVSRGSGMRPWVLCQRRRVVILRACADGWPTG